MYDFRNNTGDGSRLCFRVFLRGKIGKFMCYGLVFGMILGVGIGTVIEKNQE